MSHRSEGYLQGWRSWGEGVSRTQPSTSGCSDPGLVALRSKSIFQSPALTCFVKGWVIVLGVFFLLGLQTVFSQAGLASDPVRAQSASGQFRVWAPPSRAAQSWMGNYATNQNYAHLAPTLLPVSCERIKQILWRTLGETGPWRGRVFLVLTRANSADDQVTITSEQFRDGWQYRVELPDFLERSRYVRAIVQVLLLEMANRDAATHSAEIPAWLLEGLAQEILVSSSKDEIILPPPRPAEDNFHPGMTYTFVNARFENPLRQAHRELITATPLSFQELSWPTPSQLEGPAADVYRDSAQLFVNRLLELRNGRACLRAMLGQLGQLYNWQFAFLRAFRPYFQRPLDVEKWWALQAVNFTGHDLQQTWPAQESWQKLDEVIRSPVQVRVDTNAMPLRTAVSLQTMIQEWELPRQMRALQDKLQELELLRPRVAPGLVPLVLDYYRVLSAYLQGVGTGARKKPATQQLIGQTLMQLDALDFQRAALKAPTSPKPDQATEKNALSQK